MAMSLRAKLASMHTAEPAPAPAVPAGLFEYVHRERTDFGLDRLRKSALERMALDPAFDARRALFLDTETTGLSGGAGTVAFLVGLGRLEGDAFCVYQFMLPHYAAEPLLLERVAGLAKDARWIVTFNGRSFDVPLLKNRFIMSRMPDPFDGMGHLDLIHPARRVWKLRLKDCSLSRLEQSVLGIHRTGDIPGSEVPQRFFSYLQTGDRSGLEDVVTHNRQDIISLGALLSKLDEVYAEPARQMSMLDVFSLGRAIEKRGDREAAKVCYRLAAREKPLSSVERLRERHAAGYANRQLGLLLKSEGERAESEKIWREMIDRRQMGIFPYVELAKLAEHKYNDPRQALTLTDQALAIADDHEKEALLRRRARLAARLRRRTEAE